MTTRRIPGAQCTDGRTRVAGRVEPPRRGAERASGRPDMTRLRTHRVLVAGIVIAVASPPLLTRSSSPANVGGSGIRLPLPRHRRRRSACSPASFPRSSPRRCRRSRRLFLSPAGRQPQPRQPEGCLYLIIFFATASAVGGVAALRRRSIIEATALSRRSPRRTPSSQRLYHEQAASARTAVRLAQTNSRSPYCETPTASGANSFRT